MTKVATLVLSVFVLFASTLLADVVKLKNGDKITGTVVSLLDGKLTIKTDAMGEIKIDAAQIDSLETAAPISIDLPNGSHVNGKATGGSDGQIEVEMAGGGESNVALAGASINKPPRAWTGSVVASWTRSRGNTDSDTAALDARAENRGDDDRITFDAWYRSNRNKDQSTGDWQTTERRFGADGQYDWFFRNSKAYAYGNASAEKDELADLDLRGIIGAGAGYQFVENDKMKLGAEAGLAWFYENYSNGTDTVSDPAARVAGHFTYVFAEWSSMFDDAELYKVFGAHDDYLFKNKGGFKQQITASFFAQEWVDFTWDTTPATGNAQGDVTYFIGLGWNF